MYFLALSHAPPALAIMRARSTPDERAPPNIPPNASGPKMKPTASGEMILEDSISLDEISYPFSVKIEEKVDENSKKISNTIDIMDILWQNIVLEVPLQLTEVEDLTKYQGEGWKLVSEEELNKENNPFSNLKDILGEE